MKSLLDLSVIIPVHNCANLLMDRFQYLKSLYSSKINFEIIYINDGSTDNSKEVLTSIIDANTFVKVITQENQGPSVARNTGIENANGKYIQFLDADDYLEIPLVLKLLKKAVAANIDVLGYQSKKVDENKQSLGEQTNFLGTYNTIISGKEALLAGYHPYSIWLFLFKRSFINENQFRFVPNVVHEDVEFMMRIMLGAKKVFFVDKIAHLYVQRKGSITKPLTDKKLQQLLFDNIIVSSLMRHNITKNTEKSIRIVIEKNYNAIVWYLLWRFVFKRNWVATDFKIMCLKELKNKKLYPIRGSLKTNFQNITRLAFNQEWFLKLIFKI